MKVSAASVLTQAVLGLAQATLRLLARRVGRPSHRYSHTQSRTIVDHLSSTVTDTETLALRDSLTIPAPEEGLVILPLNHLFQHRAQRFGRASPGPLCPIPARLPSDEEL